MQLSIKIFDKRINTERLLLRKIEMTDLNDIFEYTSNPQVTKFLFWDTHSNKEQTLRFLKDTLDEYKQDNTRYTWGIVLKGENKLIGVVSIFFVSYISKRVEISYILNPEFQGKGYMKEALVAVLDFIFNDAGFVRIQARCTDDNHASEKLLRSIGMSLEGTLKKYWFLKNSYRNVNIYAITK